MEPYPLSGAWRFSIDPHLQGESQGWYKPDFQDSAWSEVQVPHTWNVMPEHRDYSGSAWYRRRFNLPDSVAGQRAILRFEAIFYKARIWMNGALVGEHEGGYTPFELEASDFILPGRPNLLAVQVDNQRASNRIPADLSEQWSYDWWNYGGIVREANLEFTHHVFIDKVKITSTPELDGPDRASSADVNVRLEITNTSRQVFQGNVHYTIIDENKNQVIASAPLETKINIPAGDSQLFLFELRISQPNLWHFDHPNLYRLTLSLVDSTGQESDSTVEIFGIRKVELKDNRFWLNGEAVRLVGLTRHADSPQAGLAETVSIMAADYNDLKSLNEVFTRPVHYAQSKFILDYADRHGILFIPEIPAWQLTAFQMGLKGMRQKEKDQLREMVESSLNHPSIWAWSIGNEFESDTPAGHAFTKEMVAFLKSIDPTRPVGFASNHLGSNPEMDATAYTDFILMNQYFGTWAGPKSALSPALDAIHQTWPEKTVFISEFGFEPRWQQLMWPPLGELDSQEYYFITQDVPADSPQADQQRQQLILDQMAIFRSKPFIAGAVFWTYQDYRTPSNFLMGVVAADREKRGSWELLRQEFSPILIESCKLSLAENGEHAVKVILRSRSDLPAYTLRNYRLDWKILSDGEGAIPNEESIPLPELAPGQKWEAAWTLPPSSTRVSLHLEIFRPTGFSVISAECSE